MANVHATSWEYAFALDPHTVRIYYFAGIEPCTVLDHVAVAYRTGAIVITLYTGSDPSAVNQMCAALARSTAVDVSLSEPINSREFIDGSTEKPATPTKPVEM